MVGRDYLLDKPAPPSRFATRARQELLPPVIDAAAAFEGAVETLGAYIRSAPAIAIITGVVLGLALATGPRRRAAKPRIRAYFG